MTKKTQEVSKLPSGLDLSAINSQVQIMVQRANEFQVTTIEHVDVANDMIKKIHRGLKKLEEKRTFYTKPQNEIIRAINKAFKSLSAPLSDAKAVLSKKIIDFRETERRRVEEANKKAEAEEARLREEAIAKGSAAPPPVVKREKEEFSSAAVTTRDKWTWEIIDESAIPREFLCVDVKKISEVVRKQKDKTNIPGIKVNKESIVVAR